MEYPSRNDFFLKFKAIYDQNYKFLDYILVDSSENINYAINNRINYIIGKKISEIVTDSKADVLNLKDIHYHMIPNTKRKFEIYSEELERWYSINIFSDERDYLLLFYADISIYKKGDTIPPIKSNMNYTESVKYCI